MLSPLFYLSARWRARDPVFWVVTGSCVLVLLALPEVALFAFEGRGKMIADLSVSTLFLGTLLFCWLAPPAVQGGGEGPLSFGLLAPWSRRAAYLGFFLHYAWTAGAFLLIAFPFSALVRGSDAGALQDALARLFLGAALLWLLLFAILSLAGGAVFPGRAAAAAGWALVAFLGAAALAAAERRSPGLIGPASADSWRVFVLALLWYAVFLALRVFLAHLPAVLAGAALYVLLHLPAAFGGGAAGAAFLLPRLDLIFPIHADPSSGTGPTPAANLAWISIYGLGYTFALVSGGSFLFARREGG